MPEKSCGTCLHWGKAGFAKRRARCRRHAPQHSGVVYGPGVKRPDSGVWPVTSRDDCCGEWKPQEVEN